MRTHGIASLAAVGAGLLLSLAGSAALASGVDGMGSRTCMGRVALPPTYESRDVRVIDAPGRVDRRYVAARVIQTWRRELVRPARVERVRTPALYRTLSSSVMVAGPRRWMHEPARFETRSEPVAMTPGHWVWRRRYGPVVSGPPQPGQTVVEATGVVLCKVWCPAQYGEVQRRVMISPGRAYAVPTMVRRWTERRVLVRPAAMTERRVGPVYRQIAMTRTVAPARMEVVRWPARYHVEQERRVVPGGEGWSPVVCGGPLSPPALQHMQSSLAARGYDPGPADGQERPQTYDALRRFQTDRHMPAGQITTDSARALGVIP